MQTVEIAILLGHESYPSFLYTIGFAKLIPLEGLRFCKKIVWIEASRMILDLRSNTDFSIEMSIQDSLQVIQL